jgi:membrane fusion protein, copper/silver efflux system
MTLLSAVIGIATIAAYLFSREPGSTAPDTTHRHSGPSVSDSAMPVVLSARDAARIGVTYAVTTLSPMQREIRTVGQVTFDETRVKVISPKIDGWVEELSVNFTGQHVSAGAPLLRVYSPMLVTAQEELLLAKRLVADVTDGTPDARTGAEELVASARRRLSHWGIPSREIEMIETSGQVLRTLTLRAPVSGVVVERNVFEGQRIMAGDALYRIADLGIVWVDGEVFEKDLPSVRLGQRVVASFEALPGASVTGRISYVYPMINPDTRTARVRVALPNPGLRFKPGMYATLTMETTASTPTLTVPRSAVLSTGERHIVFVKGPTGALAARQIDVGSASAAWVEVLRGLAAGDTIVASATFLIDAESNLGSALGVMGDMPGMDITSPPTKPTRRRGPPEESTERPRLKGERSDHASHPKPGGEA